MTTDREVSNALELLEHQRNQLEALKLQKKAIEEAGQYLGKGKELLQTNLDLHSQTHRLMEQEVGQLQRAQKAIEGGADAQEELNKLRALGLDIGLDGGRLDAAAIKDRQTLLELSRKNVQSQQAANSAAATILKRTLGISDAWQGTLTGALLTGAASGRLLGTMKSMADPLNIAMSTLEKIKEITTMAVMEFDAMSASIRRITGADSDLANQAYESHRAMLSYGVTIGEAGEATNALLREMAGFSHSLDTNQNLLRDQAALLNEVGVEFGTTAKMMNILDKGLGMSAPEIKDYTAKLYDMSEQLKVPPDVIFKDWQASSKELMKYGDGMLEVLEGLEQQSKNTGLAVGDLLGIAKQFDQFDTAGEAVGRLNAILGGPYLNAIDMVYMTEDQRIEALRETISLSGQVWKDMGRHEQQAIATAAGISDMAVAAQLFGGTQQEFADASSNQEALAKRAQESQKAMDQMKQAMMAFAVAVQPIVEMLGGIAQWFAELAQNKLAATVMQLATIFTTFYGVMMAVKSATAAAAAIQAAKLLLTGQETIATIANTTAQVAQVAIQRQQVINHYGLVKGVGMLIKATWLSTKAAWAASVGWAKLAIAMKGVGIAAAGVVAAVMMFKIVDNMLAGFGKTAKIIIGIVLALAGAFAVFYAISTLGVGLAGIVAAGAAAGLAVAGMKATVDGIMMHDGGVVPGIRGEDKQATLAAGETVLPTHKKSDDQAVADAEAKGQLSLTKDKGFEEVTQAINNLVAKLNTMITQSEERAKGGGKEKAVEVTMELDRDKVGEATASWLEEKYGWTGA